MNESFYIKASHHKVRTETLKLLWKYERVLNIYSLVIRGHSNDTKNFGSLYVGVQMTNKSGWKYGEVPVTILWTLTKP